MPGPTGDIDPPLFTGSLRIRGDVRVWAGTNEAELASPGGGGGTPGWPEVLDEDFHSGENDPHIDEDRYLSFHNADALPTAGDIRSSAGLEIEAVGDVLVHTPFNIELSAHSGAAAASARINADVIRLLTDDIERLEIEPTGGWQLGGLVGTAGQYIRSAGAGAPPTWATILFSEVSGGGWADVLAKSNNSGAFNPHVDDGQFLGFGVEGSLPGSGEIRSSDAFTINVTGAAALVGSTTVSVTGGGTNGLSASSAAAILGAGTTGITAATSTFLRFTTANVERLEIEATGAWQLGGVVGTAGQYARSAGPGAPPTWATIDIGDLGAIAAESFLGNFTAGSAAPTARAGSSVAGGGLTYTAGGTLAVGAGTLITVNANDVQVSPGASETFLGNFTAGSAVATYRAGSSVAGLGLLYSAGGTLSVGAGSGLTVNADDVQISPISAESFFGNFTAGSAVPASRPGSSVAGNGLTYAAGGTLAVGAGSFITVAANDVAVDLATLVPAIDSASVVANGTVLERAAITGAIAIAQNSNQSLFAGIRNNGGATTDRANLNFINSSTLSATLLDDAGNDEIEVAFTILADGVTNTHLANMAANTIKANPTGSSADPQDVAVAADSVLARVGGNLVSHPWSTLAGTRLTYAAGVMDVDLAAAYAWTGVHSWTGTGNWTVNRSGDVNITGTIVGIDSDTSMLIHADNDLTLSSDADVRISCDALRVASNAGAGVAGFIIVDAVSASTPSLVANEGMFWASDPGAAPTQPMYTDDANGDYQIATVHTQSVSGSHITDGTAVDFSTSRAPICIILAAAASSIGAVTGGYSGRLLFLVSASSGTATIDHQAAGAATGNQLNNPGGADLAVLRGGALFCHDGSTWRNVATGTVA